MVAVYAKSGTVSEIARTGPPVLKEALNVQWT